MDRIYIVTGANGHLGGTIVRMLRRAGATVRGLVLPAEKVADARSEEHTSELQSPS